MNEWMNIIAKRELDEDEIQKILGPLVNRRAKRKLKEQGIMNKPKQITPQQRNVMVGQNAPSMIDLPNVQDTDSLLAEAGQTAQNLKVAELQRQLGSAPTTAQNVPSAPNLPPVSYENVQGAPTYLRATQEERRRIAAEAAQQSQKDIKAGRKQQKKDAKAAAKQQKKDAKAKAAMPRDYVLQPKQKQSSFRPRQQTGRLRPKNQPNVQPQPNVPVEATSVPLPVKQKPPNRQAQAAQERQQMQQQSQVPLNTKGMLEGIMSQGKMKEANEFLNMVNSGNAQGAMNWAKSKGFKPVKQKEAEQDA